MAVALRKSRTFLVFFLCLYSFLFNFQPANSFIVDIYVKVKHMSLDQVNHSIFPTWTYSYFVFLLVLGAPSEHFSFRTLIILGVSAQLITLILLLYTEGLHMMILSQVSMGFATATFRGFSGAIFKYAPKELYDRVSSLTRGSTLFGILLSAVFSQVFFVYLDFSLVFLVQISLAAMVLSFLFGFFLPNFEKKETESEDRCSINKPIEHTQNICEDCCHETLLNSEDSSEQKQANYGTIVVPVVTACELENAAKAESNSMWKVLFVSYRNSHRLRRWSFWCALSLAIHQLCMVYWQSLFLEIDPSAHNNGWIAASTYLTATLASLATGPSGCIQRVTKKFSNALLLITPLLSSLSLFAMCNATTLQHAYIGFSAYHALFEFMFPVTHTIIALSIENSLYTLLFSTNAAVSLLFQFVIQISIDKGFKLDIRTVYRAFSFITLGLACLVVLDGLIFGLVTYIRSRKAHSTTPAEEDSFPPPSPPPSPSAVTD
eukprot:GCRY01003627.1.p1 GENE.GCRY01003627.1~~GCRY01003627.1.p1  ORF type:complete len:490 (+),score=105.35 GCRY01003627.1:216-1685(+)